ncbi:hypothetical protein IMSAG025_00935 [Muribaculaceae bacterium]|nr:hypothetical protein IMSAG025_00935 [Muribaculaceae bacterium]
MLQKVELIVLCLSDEVIALNIDRTGRACAERWICEYDIKKFLGLLFERVCTNDRTAVSADTMQIEVH